MSFRLFSRAPLMTIEPRVGRAPRLRRLDRQLAPEIRAGQRAVAVLEQLRRRALEDQLPAVLAGAGAEIDHVVGGADRLLVVLDDDDGVAEVAQARQRAEQRAVVALVQADRRLVEDVEHAGQVRADLRRQPDALPFAARQRRGAARRASGSRRRRRSGSAGDRGSRAGCGWRSAFSRSVSSSAVEELQRLGDRQVDVLGHRAPLDATARLCGFSRAPWQDGHGRSARYGSRLSCSTQLPSS